MMTEISESKFQECLARGLKRHYSRKTAKNVVRERLVRIHEDDYRIDIAIINKDIAIECKTSSASLKKGIGQAIRYEVDGWSSYLAIPRSEYFDAARKMCLQAGVGLIVFNGDPNKDRCAFDVIIQNDIEIEGSPAGVRTSGATRPYKILNSLEIDNLKDLAQLEDKILNNRIVVTDDKKYIDGRKKKIDHSILPETK